MAYNYSQPPTNYNQFGQGINPLPQANPYPNVYPPMEYIHMELKVRSLRSYFYFNKSKTRFIQTKKGRFERYQPNGLSLFIRKWEVRLYTGEEYKFAGIHDLLDGTLMGLTSTNRFSQEIIALYWAQIERIK